MLDKDDPIHYLSVTMWKYDKTEELPGWYFWTKLLVDRQGPYPSEAEARAALAIAP